jgi:hypothetical protein
MTSTSRLWRSAYLVTSIRFVNAYGARSAWLPITIRFVIK